ncbi:MAG: D-2-hydroxyacid dehydrogenase [Anaerolineales bacterium]|nr:D-2-hydroxyacid dehydrogenase [Anaerolineales bacterium]
MKNILMLTKDHDAYRALVAAELPDVNILTEPTDECEIVLGAPSMIARELDNLPNVKWVQSTWAGVEPLLDPSLRRDYVLTNARGVFGGLMSEFVFGYLLAHERKIFELSQAQQRREWMRFLTGTLRGKTIGLLGVGSIGAEVARTAKFFGMTVRGYTRSSEDCEFVDEYFHAVPPLPEGRVPTRVEGRGEGVLKFADKLDYLISILPNTKDTRKLVDADLFSALPPHCLFINVGRGSAVDESALISALENDKLAGAVLDVFEQEPLPQEHPFWTTKNLQMTFHTSAPSFPEDIAGVFIENYRLYIEGKPLKYQVDFERGY